MPISPAVARALRLIRVHGSVVRVTVQAVDPSGFVVALVEVNTGLPSEWRAVGHSPSGVWTVEPVRFRFGPNYPVTPPDIRLRADFDRSHPHIQPGSAEELPEPCLFAGSSRELLRLRGILGLVEQLADWLEKAATLELIDPKQGWEPVRRDHIDDVLIADGSWLKGLAKNDAGCSAFKVRYLVQTYGDLSEYSVTLRKAERVALGPDLSGEFTFGQSDDVRSGNGIALVAWSGKKPDGTAFIADHYLPETVVTVDDLLDRAQLLGCREYLEPMLALLQERFRKTKMKVSVPLAVVLLAKRPCAVIGGNGSAYELCPYVVELQGRDDLSGSSPKIVRPAMHRDDISEALMRTASGEGNESSPPWTLIGCGSVGSKIAMHMARAGRAPSDIVDRANMLPHNYARHAIYPGSFGKKYGLVDGKARLLQSALSDLGSTTKEHTRDIISYILANKSLGTTVAKNCSAVVNTTGSATVRETLGSTAHSGNRPPIVEACLLGEGRAALMTVEGPDANPSTTDLICEAYLEIYRRPELAERIFNTQATEVAVGQGCSALTMPLRDSRLSLFQQRLQRNSTVFKAADCHLKADFYCSAASARME